MGGAAAGEVASSMAVESVFEAMAVDPAETPAEERLAAFARRMRLAAYGANQKIFDSSRSDVARAGMGTTMTAVGTVDDQLVMAQVGDSRAYLLRGQTLTQVTRDQSLVNQLVETGQITEEQAKLFEHSNVILQALGVQADVEVLLSTVPMRRGDRVVVCSDGLTGVVTDEEVAAVVGATDDAAESCRLLIEMARAAGGPDNITVVVARFEGETLKEATEADTVKYERWRLDEPEAPPQAAAAEPAPAETTAVESPGPRTTQPIERPVAQAELFFSSMLLLALALGGVIVASLLFRAAPAIECTVSAAAPGLSVRVDGRDTGARTRDGEIAVKLPPGRHRVGLRGPGAPVYERVVEADEAGCAARFETTAP
jgi:serine/threonine protein phosphatase PrpC